MPKFEDVQKGYANMWTRMTIRPEYHNAVHAIANRLVTHRLRYDGVAMMIGCPWYFIAVIHNLESGANFTTHLHNGDPLSARTHHVPSGRPKSGNPPFTWQESAIDALRLKGLDKIKDWSLSRILFEWERYNGFGYYGKVNSPYLWSFSNLYQKGKYVADGKYSATAVSKQCGAAVILRTMLEKGHASVTSAKPEITGEVPIPGLPKRKEADNFFVRIFSWIWEYLK